MMPPEYPESIINLAHYFPDCIFVIDEAFIDFTDYISLINYGSTLNHLPDNIIIIKSLTKIFAVPGLRNWLRNCTGINIPVAQG